MKIRVIKVKAKSIFTRSKLPGVKWAINQYVGCQHACLYCYAKFIAKWRPIDYGKWGSWVETKINAPELVKGKYVDDWVYMSSISDPYHPIEKELKLTRRILENLDKRIKLSIQTKSDLVLRDLDLIKKFKKIEVGLTINSFKGESKKIFEPYSVSNARRIEVLKILKEKGIDTFAFVSPIIPGLINLREVIKETKKFAGYYWFEMINKRGAGKEFMKILKDKFPQSYDTLKSKKKFSEFVRECKKIISSENIESRGVITHN
ncbi:MAG: radical SAM protein [Candidatus Nealsonbacteria bacterium]